MKIRAPKVRLLHHLVLCVLLPAGTQRDLPVGMVALFFFGAEGSQREKKKREREN